MDKKEYRAALKKIGLSQEKAGVWLGIGKRTSQGYALGEYPVSAPVRKLLRVMQKYRIDPAEVEGL